MWLELFLCLLLAHLVADFVFQTRVSCKSKAENHWRSVYHYAHSVIVFALAWLVTLNVRFWWCALIIGFTHFAIDMWKSYRKDDIRWFVVDQALHMLVLAGVAWLWCSMNEWDMPFGVPIKYVALIIAIIVCWKPANIFIKLVLKRYSVNMPEEKPDCFNAGALIGNLERWLIMVFVILQHYEAIGLLVAAKSIIRFGDKETTKTEYVLAGTLMSIFIAVLAGVLVTIVPA